MSSWKNTRDPSQKPNTKKIEKLSEESLMVKIEVLGTGCAKCKRLMANVQEAVKDLKITAEVIKVESIDEIVERGVMLTPALFVNGELKAEGRVPCVDEIKEMIPGGTS
jgi:small redox-active disulfide protein 2